MLEGYLFHGQSLLPSLQELTTGTTGRGGIGNFSSKNDYWVISKLTASGHYGGTSGFANGRIVGCEFTGRSGITPLGAGALIDAGANFAISFGVNTIDNLKVFGNYLHDFGTPASNNNLLHTMYFRIRSNTRTLRAPEIGWNYLHDKDGPRFGIHYYDEGSDVDGEPDVGTFIDVMRIHDNVVRDQTGPGINIGTLTSGTNNANFNVEIYNNLLIDCGRDRVLTGTNVHAFQIYGARMTGHFSIYNNTIYGFGEPENGTGYALYIPKTASLGIKSEFGGSFELKNNIFVDTNNLEFIDFNNLALPSTSTNNIWYSSYGHQPPSFEINPIISNPMFVNAASFDFNIRENSPGRNSGADTSSVLTTDILGVVRNIFDIGAFEY
ncbi:MAG: hypothetical protein A2504_13535 [Bdellovibrionales bacterium RIFOXYD12_FULL_39_22]|nr:MAG: hypothetical protein A2385_00260 [Bdellovibrionales bacterium RIFOXYB1_FULL_39_21]OFZ43890.1 MAG: hypothetical protein A2485_05270 [Bdellovibrionales bacterium RIFOXYC12_FULL_39_17]OFZ48776.1 MAG: hypothetical protein A2404_17575 [Bdellovibrionales bacterium RIFOXYC1_FULL_39_130]OFZ76509.1 MAG: hypothetical protein A2560_06240 [Bdellovibrionales bacterium RIFOXYD1_FULL_39_84]OFZ94743.1 MAG: hypothetical protein A2504_13535 [Bdellovibrionales bacterium RIFOXYD12_FULL_39_22]HLE12166.1 hy